MKIVEIRGLYGPNVFAHRPVLRAELELEDLAERSSADFPDFVQRLIATLPGLRDHRCSRGRAGGFVQRLKEGTYFAHIVERNPRLAHRVEQQPVHFAA